MSMEFDGGGAADDVLFASTSFRGFQLSFALWIYAHSDGEGNAGRFFQVRGGGALAAQAFVRDELSGQLRVSYQVRDTGGTNRTATSSGRPIAINTWTHVAGRAQLNSTIDIFVNGTEVGYSSNPMLPTVVQTVDFTRGGNTTAGTRTFDGELEDLAMFSDYLTNAEILQLYTSGMRGMPLQMTVDEVSDRHDAYWMLDDEPEPTSVDTDTAFDSGPRRNDLVGQNGPTARAGQLLSYPPNE